MNNNDPLKLQAYLDGELSEREASQIKTLIAKDSDARLLFEELQFTKTALKNNELELKLPESRDFFWSKIQKEIYRQESTPRVIPQPSLLARFQRFLLPAAGVAVVALVAMLTLQKNSNPLVTQIAQFGEVESSQDEMGTFTYRSQAEKMTVVWLYDKENSKVADSTGTDILEN